MQKKGRAGTSRAGKDVYKRQDVKVWRKPFLKNGDSERRDMKSHAV